MSSLWTPGGEHRVPREPADEVAGGPPSPDDAPRSAGSPLAPGDEGAVGPEEGLSEADLRRLTAELAAAPAETVVANHCYGLFELAALHLSVAPPQLAKARLAIDSLALLVEGLGDRLGEHAGELAAALDQLRLAYVRVADAQATAPGSDGASAGPPA